MIEIEDYAIRHLMRCCFLPEIEKRSPRQLGSDRLVNSNLYLRSKFPDETLAFLKSPYLYLKKGILVKSTCNSLYSALQVAYINTIFFTGASFRGIEQIAKTTSPGWSWVVV